MTSTAAWRQKAALDTPVLPTGTLARFLLLVVTTSAGVTYLFPDFIGGFASGSRSDIGSLASFWVLVLGLYWWLPRRRVRRRRLMPITPERLPSLAARLEDLRREVLPARRVTFFVDLLDGKVNGVAFGRIGARSVVLSHALVNLADADPLRFRAIVLHELAHVKNRDLDISVISIMTFRLYVVGAIIPWLLEYLFKLYTRQDASSGYVGFVIMLHLLVLSAFVPLARNAVLRSRELHADATATRWTTAGNLTVLFDTPQGKGEGWVDRVPVRPHPPLSLRRQVSDAGDVPSGMGMWDAFAMGFAISLAMAMLAWLKVKPTIIPTSFIIPLSFVFGMALCLGVWRQVTSEDPRIPPRRLTGLGVRLALGLGLGLVLSPVFAFLMGSLRRVVVDIFALWWLLVTGGCVVFFHWMAAIARSWAPVIDARGRPIAVVAGTSVLAALLFSNWLSRAYGTVFVAPATTEHPLFCGWLFDYSRLPEICTFDLNGTVPPFARLVVFVEHLVREGGLGAIASPFAEIDVACMLLAIALPLVGLRLGRRSAVDLGLRPTIVIGLVAAGVAFAASLAAPIRSLSVLPVGVLLAGAAACVATTRAGPFDALHGLLAGAVSSAGPIFVVVSYTAFGASDDLGVAEFIRPVQVVHMCVVAAFLCALLTVLVKRVRYRVCPPG